MSERSPADLRETLARWAAEPQAWAGLVDHDSGERTHALLHHDEDLELYVVSWMPGHDTGFHDHDDSSAGIMVVSGAISEERLTFGGAAQVTVRAGETVSIAREAIHRVRHTGLVPSVTLHAYSPPLRRVGTYEIAKDGVLLRHPRSSDVTLEAAAA